jgi:serine/threonine protein kinase
MKSRLASVRDEGGLDRVDRAVQLLEEEWRRHGEVHLEDFWADQRRRGASDPVDSLELLAALVKADLRFRFDQGQLPTAALYLERFPELRGSGSRVVSLVYEEFCLRQERGAAPDVEAFCDQYPDWKSSLVAQLNYHHLFSKAAGRTPSLPRFPEPGETFEEFHLLSQLGMGGTSRVFLAKDLSLGGKQVALKVTLDRSLEPKVQGVLDHPHIVPVNSVIYPTEGELCGLSMPFRPGLPLDEIIERLGLAKPPRSALAIWQVLVRRANEGQSSPIARLRGRSVDRRRPAGPRGDGWDGFPVGGTYAQGAAWIAMILARALHYAHGMRTFHRDVKPANVLLTLQNGPQLLDFNLAESPHSADRARAALHGGTPPYMAPEQIEAFLNPDLWGKVGAQADIYSLGLVLRELLTGQRPEAPDRNVPAARGLRDLLDRRPRLDVAVRNFNPRIPHALAAIVAKCLALEPKDRYATAESLAYDLERFLAHQPLTQAANPSRRERLTNWVLRRQRMLTGVAASLLIAGALASGVAITARSLAHSRTEPPKPSVESSPIFQTAVSWVADGDYKRAEGPLRKLVAEYPDSCLSKIYLALTIDQLVPFTPGEMPPREATSKLREALALPDKEKSRVVAWNAEHPEIAAFLVDFADTRIQYVDRYADKIDQQDDDDEERDQAARTPTYELAAAALQLAQKLGTDSPDLQFLLAKTEEVLGDYSSAHRRLSHLIAQLRTPSSRNDTLLFFCREVRGRVAYLLVDDLRSRRDRVDAATVTMLKEAQHDLDDCDHILSVSNFSEDQSRKRYFVMYDKARVTLTLADVEIDLNRRAEAEKELKKSKEFKDELVAYVSSYKLKKNPAQLTKRISDILNRLSALGLGDRPDTTYPPIQSAHVGPNSR